MASVTRTGMAVQTDIYQLVKSSALAEVVSGEVYHNGQRPSDSREEDIVVTFTTGTIGDIQEGVVTINIFVPDIDAGVSTANGLWISNTRRINELEQLAAQWVADLTAERTNYLFLLQSAICTEEEPDFNQHFVVVRLRYRYYST